MELIFIENNYGIGKNSGKPYHMFKLADPLTFENHVVSYDSFSIRPESIDFQRGQKVKISGVLTTPYQNTQFLCTSIKPLQEVK